MSLNLKSFSLDKSTGKKCYMLCARNLMISGGDPPAHWLWTPEPECRFGEVAELISAYGLEIRGKISASLLSPATFYSAYLVFKLTTETYGFFDRPLEVSMRLAGADSPTRSVYLGTKDQRRMLQFLAEQKRKVSWRHMFPNYAYPRKSKDGWFEIKLGKFYNNEGEEGEIEMSVLENKFLNRKRGLIVQGIEIRPRRR